MKIFWAIVVSVLTAGYLLPTGIAIAREHKSAMNIFLLNLLLGWTFIGWIAALIWSFSK